MLLNDPHERERLFNAFDFLQSEYEKSSDREDQTWSRSIVNIRNTFSPSPIGAFDEFEALMRDRQGYLTEHPNPYYQGIVIRMHPDTAESIIQSLDSTVRDFVNRTVESYLGRETQHVRNIEVSED